MAPPTLADRLRHILDAIADVRAYTEGKTYDEYLARNLKVADATAISMARDYQLPMIFFSLDTDGTIVRVVSGEKIGTIVHS